MNRKRNSEHLDPIHPIVSTKRYDDAGDDMCTDLIRSFASITLNDRFDLVVVPKTKRAKNDNPNTDFIHIESVYVEDRMEKKIIILEQKIKNMTKKINMLSTIVHNQCIMKEQSPYIN